ncbi:MAG: hypothetical protein KY428_06325 [Bacteroidetes bacterium]|nr:hypothetical protein [Bacteroidota bacterium]
MKLYFHTVNVLTNTQAINANVVITIYKTREEVQLKPRTGTIKEEGSGGNAIVAIDVKGLKMLKNTEKATEMR